VQENQPDRIADLLEEAANTIEQYMTDKGYEVTTHEKQAEFDKKRNYTYDQ
jgi:hypothetical protein